MLEWFSNAVMPIESPFENHLIETKKPWRKCVSQLVYITPHILQGFYRQRLLPPGKDYVEFFDVIKECLL